MVSGGQRGKVGAGLLQGCGKASARGQPAGGDAVSPGGEGKPGRVVDIRGWDVETGRSVASVTWADGTTNVYRVGHKGKVDLKCVGEAAGGFYYKEHLPRLGTAVPTDAPASCCLPRRSLKQAVPEGRGGAPLSSCHLPPGRPAELQRRVSADGQPLPRGDKVKCLLDTAILRETEEGHGGGNPRTVEVRRPAC